MSAVAQITPVQTKRVAQVLASERLALKRQGMAGFVLVYPDRHWGGTVFTSRDSAVRTRRRDPGAWLLLANLAGELFFEQEGRATGRVGKHPMLPASIDIRPASRRRMKRVAAARA